ncbi:MAG: amino acid synthesis family protein [Pseudomonadota bacterium]
MSDIEIRRSLVMSETLPHACVENEGRDLQRAVGVLVIANPFLTEASRELSRHYHLGGQIGELLAPRVVSALSEPACTYGKAALVGASGSHKHGAVLLHPSLGKPVRRVLGGGEAVIPSNIKVTHPGDSIDLPLAHKDDAWSFDHLDTMTISIPESPKADEIVVMVAFGTGSRSKI